MATLRLIAGSGRSGTTWVLDAIAEANQLRPVFEPLHPDSSSIAREFCYACLDRCGEHDDLKKFLVAIANNASRSIWTSYRVNPTRIGLTREHLHSASNLKLLLRKWNLLGRRYWTYRETERRNSVLVKCIRANLMLDWIHAKIDSKIVLLMRHPCAVVESQLRFPEVWDPYWLLARYRNDGTLVQGPLRDIAGILDQEFSRTQALAAIWCIENLVPASQAGANGYRIVFYEELLERPDVEWQRVTNGLGLVAVPSASLLREPSQQSEVRLNKREASNDSYSRSYASWQERLTTTDLQQIAQILQAFGVGFYSVADSRPDVDRFTREFLSS